MMIHAPCMYHTESELTASCCMFLPVVTAYRCSVNLFGTSQTASKFRASRLRILPSKDRVEVSHPLGR